MGSVPLRSLILVALMAVGLLPLASLSSISLADVPIKPDEAVIQCLQPILEKHQVPGLVGAIIQGDRVVAIGAVGVRKQGDSNPITIHDQMHIGSCTKAMTATLLGLMVQEGKLQWSSTLAELFPKHASLMHADYRTVTLEQLLTHRAGLPANTDWWRLGADRPTNLQRETLLKNVLKDAPKHPPGSRFEYSNVGYALAGHVAEVLAGKSWEALMKERLFQPLGMSSAGFGPPGGKGKLDQPWGHLLRGDKLTPQQHDNAPALGPAGTAHTSLIDWAKFCAVHLGASQGPSALLKPELLQQMHTPPQGQKYAMGWNVVDRSWAGGQALNHAGSNTMWYAVAWLAPKRRFGVLVVTNQGGEPATKACDAASASLIDHYEKAMGKKQ